MDEDSKRANFKKQLDEQHSWPTLYMFKFIVPKTKEGEVLELFPSNEISTKESNNGKYVSVTAKVMMQSSETVVAVYEKAHAIEGVIAL